MDTKFTLLMLAILSLAGNWHRRCRRGELYDCRGYTNSSWRNPIGVYAYNAQGDCVTGACVAIDDDASADPPVFSVTNVTFTDADSDAGQIGGNLVDAAGFEEYITGYNIYFVNDANVKVGVALGTVVPGQILYYSE